MIRLKTYNQPTSTYEYIKMMTLQRMSQANIQLELEEVSDWSMIINDKIPSLPSFMINNSEVFSYDEKQTVAEFIDELSTELLKKENFGTMTKIIVPTDFSDTATNALVYAYNLGVDLGSVLMLTHVYRPTISELDGTIRINSASESQKKKQLCDYTNKINGSWIYTRDKFVPIEPKFLSGFPTEEIDALRKNFGDQNLVVVGSTGEGKSTKRIFGSISTDLAIRGGGDTLLVPPQATYHGFHKVVYATCDLDHDLKSINRLIPYLHERECALKLVHVQDESSKYDFESLIQSILQKAPHLHVSHHQIQGKNITSSLLQFCSDEDIDLLCLSKGKRNILENIFHTSVTKKAILETTLPLLIIHPKN